MQSSHVLNLKIYIVLFLISFFLSLLLTPLSGRLALRKGIIAIPKKDRWHKGKIPLLGGVSIFLSHILVSALAFIVFGINQPDIKYIAFFISAFFIFLLGLMDDIVCIEAHHKLVSQIVISSLILFFGFRLNWTSSNTLNFIISLLWFVSIVNAFNLIDNMDGLSAGIAFIAAGFIFFNVYFYEIADKDSLVVLAILSSFMGTLLGFLIFNFNPASIFMGDSGSLYLGFVLATFSTYVIKTGGGPSGVHHLLSVIAVPIFILFIPLLDTLFVSIMRKLFKRPIYQGGKDHSSHRMVAIGFSERKTVLILYIFSVISGFLALSLNYLSTWTALALICVYLLFIGFFWVYLSKVKVYEHNSISYTYLRPIFSHISYMKIPLQMLLDIILITLSYYISYLLRFEGDIGANFNFFLKSLPILIAFQIFSFYTVGIYKRIWGSTGIGDLIDYAKAISLGTISTILVLLFLYRFMSFSRVVFILYWILMLLLTSLSRLSFRIIEEGVKRSKLDGIPALIYGAGVGGEILLKEIENNSSLNMRVVGFIDDNRDMQGKQIRGYPVLGDESRVIDLIDRYGIKRIVISFKEGGDKKRVYLEEICRKNNLDVVILQMKLLIF